MIARITSLAVALLATTAAASPFAAKQTPADNQSAYMSKLMSKAVPTKNSQLRKLDGAQEFELDITGYSLKFTKCQFVKAYSQDLADEGADTVLATQRFVIFRLCPSDYCSSCSAGYGEYAIDMDTYLEYTVEYRQNEQDEMCEACEEDCQYYGDDAVQADDKAAGDDAANEADGDEEEGDEEDGDEEDGDERRKLAKANRALRGLSSDCSTCVSDCEKIENMEANYYIDATTFIECQQIQEDNGYGALYAGPMCASRGSKIKIGVFTDEDCMYLDTSKDVENYLADEDGNAYKVSHALLKTVYDDSECINCLDAYDGDDDAGEDATLEVCANLYEAAGKCESVHGFSSGINAYYADGNQAANEDLVCEFISSLHSGTYSQDGEIVIGGSNLSGGSSTTGGQKFALTFFIIGTVGLAVYAAMLHSQLTKGGKADLSSQGGAMA